MRILIELHSSAHSPREWAADRYALNLARAIARNRGHHDVLVLLSNRSPLAIRRVREFFHGVLPPDALRICTGAELLGTIDGKGRVDDLALSEWRRAYVASFAPDCLFSNRAFTEPNPVERVDALGMPELYTAALLHDPRPFLNSSMFTHGELDGVSHVAGRHGARRLLTATEHAAARISVEASDPVWDISPIGIAADPTFRPHATGPVETDALAAAFGLSPGYVLCFVPGEPGVTASLLQALATARSVSEQQRHLVFVDDESRGRSSSFERDIRAAKLDRDRVRLIAPTDTDALALVINGSGAVVMPDTASLSVFQLAEAVACGRAVVTPDQPAHAEVVGSSKTLFKSGDLAEMAAVLDRVLLDDSEGKRVQKEALARSRSFDWNRIGVQAIEALTARPPKDRTPSLAAAERPRKLRLAYVSPLPPQRSGVSFYSAELLPALAKHYDIDVVTSGQSVCDPWVAANLGVRTVKEFRAASASYDRVIYQFGNSEFHTHMFELLEAVPGIAVLHDFFLSGVQGFRGYDNFDNALVASHGLQAFVRAAEMPDREEAAWHFPISREVLQNARGVVLHSEHAVELAANWYGAPVKSKVSVIPQLRRGQDHVPSRDAARQRLGLSPDAFVIGAFGLINGVKATEETIEAFRRSKLSGNSQAQFVFVGELTDKHSAQAIQSQIASSGLADRIHITGWQASESYDDYMDVVDIAVQLRRRSRGETSRAVLDCMARGTPVIANAHGSLAELDPDAVLLLNDQFTVLELAQAIDRLADNKELREKFGSRARKVIAAEHSPESYASRLTGFIEERWVAPDEVGFDMPGKLHSSGLTNVNEDRLAQHLAMDFPPTPRDRMLFVDVSPISDMDIGTGIQRAVRSLLRAMLCRQDLPLTVVPVRRGVRGWFHTDYTYGASVLGVEPEHLTEHRIDAYPGDVFLGLDLDGYRTEQLKAELNQMWQRGVGVFHVLYDLLPIQKPHLFPASEKWFQPWLSEVVEFDGVVCISKAVAEELTGWLVQHAPERQHLLDVSWFHLGATMERLISTTGIPKDADILLGAMNRRPSILMVGTLEPRKGHIQTLDAFEELWQRGVEVNLVIVGKQGWHTEAFAARISDHEALGEYLFWPRAVSDEYLERIYAASACVLMASEGEGFGLPLIEAARHKVPILARRLPVFEEVAGDHATYFDGTNGSSLADALTLWLEDWELGRCPQSDGMPWLTWAQSAEQLLRAIGVLESDSDALAYDGPVVTGLQ